MRERHALLIVQLSKPGIVISPFAKKGYIDHTQYETVSILSFIEKRFGLSPLSSRDKNADPFSNAFEIGHYGHEDTNQ